jgi:hypothetical protein
MAALKDAELWQNPQVCFFVFPIFFVNAHVYPGAYLHARLVYIAIVSSLLAGFCAAMPALIAQLMPLLVKSRYCYCAIKYTELLQELR